MPRIRFNAFAVQAPRGWADITDEVEVEDPPYTIARPRNGVGALQFSIALYDSGPIPNPKPKDLLSMVKEFGRKRRLGKPADVVTEPGPPRLAAASYDWEEDFVRVWQVSDGRSFAFITYTCAAEQAGPELPACEKIVRSIVFEQG